MKRPTQSPSVPPLAGIRPAPRRPVPPGAPAVRPDPRGSDPHGAASGGDRGAPGDASAQPPATVDPHELTRPAVPASSLGLPEAGGDQPLFAGRYRIVRKLGQGGMGSVFLATQLAVGRNVAVKVLENAPDDAVMVARFQREARVIAQLQHPNIVNLIDFGENERGQLFLVMEYIDGEPLSALIAREAPLPAERVVHIGLQVLDALAAAHDIGVVHRDLKPDNIMLLQGAGRRDYVKILDFGIAKVTHSEAGRQDTVQTRAGLIVGSLRYISPEQVEAKEITPRTDLYALGTILYELLGRRRVFDYPSAADCAIAHLAERPRPPEVDGVPLSGPLVSFIMACLEKAPQHRPTSAHVAIALLRGAEAAPLVTAERSRPHSGLRSLPPGASPSPAAQERPTALEIPAVSVVPTERGATPVSRSEPRPRPLGSPTEAAPARSPTPPSAVSSPYAADPRPTGPRARPASSPQLDGPAPPASLPGASAPPPASAADAGAAALLPRSKGVSRPAAGAADPSLLRPLTSPGSPTLVVDCSLDPPRHPSEGLPAGAPSADLALRGTPGAGSPRAAHGAGHGASAIAARPTTARTGTHPLLLALVFLGLAAVGALVYILLIHPALQGP